jgi:hypothetical protein
MSSRGRLADSWTAERPADRWSQWASLYQVWLVQNDALETFSAFVIFRLQPGLARAISQARGSQPVFLRSQPALSAQSPNPDHG